MYTKDGKTFLNWNDVTNRIAQVTYRLDGKRYYGIPKGGLIVAMHTDRARPSLHPMSIPWGCQLVLDPEHAEVFLDDILDSGRTRDRWLARYPGREFVALWDRENPLPGDPAGWLVFPWEVDEAPAVDAAVRLCEAAGVDPALADRLQPNLISWVKQYAEAVECGREWHSPFDSD